MVIKLKLIQKKLLNYLKNVCNKFININEFNEEYNKFKNDVAKLENFKSKNDSSFSIKQQQQQQKKI